MSISSLDLNPSDLLVFDSLDPSIGDDIVCARVVGLVRAYMESASFNPSFDSNSLKIKHSLDVIENLSAPLTQVSKALACIRDTIKSLYETGRGEMDFLVQLGDYYAEKLDRDESCLSQENKDLLTDFLRCKESWLHSEPPFIRELSEEMDWDISSLIGLFSCLRFFPAPWAAKEYLRSLRPEVFHLLDQNGQITDFLEKDTLTLSDTQQLLDGIDQILVNRLPQSFPHMREYFVFSFTTPLLHELYTRLYILALGSGAKSSDDVTVCSNYLIQLSPKNLVSLQAQLFRKICEKLSISADGATASFSSILQTKLSRVLQDVYSNPEAFHVEDGQYEEYAIIASIRHLLAISNDEEVDEIKFALPKELVDLFADMPLCMVNNPDEALSCLVIDDFFAADVSVQKTKKVFTKCVGGSGCQSSLIYYRREDLAAVVETHAAESTDLYIPVGKKFSQELLAKSPIFEKLKCKEPIVDEINALIAKANFHEIFDNFLLALKQEDWFLTCRINPLQKAHLSTIAFCSKQISLEELLIVHRVCEAMRDSTVTAQFFVLDTSNIEQYLQDCNYPPYTYKKTTKRQKVFKEFLASIKDLSIVQRTSVEYSLNLRSSANVERYILEKGGYNEATRHVERDDEMKVFQVLLPPSVNISLYSVFLAGHEKRGLSDYVFGFGYSEDPTPFFHGKRPVSIASPYFSMEDLSSFKIHGFAQPEAKVLGLDFHDSAYHIPIEMNLKRKELDFLGFAAEAADHFSKKLFQACQDPIQKARYQKMFSVYREVILDRESFVASPGRRILDKKVELRKMEKRILHHPFIRILKSNTPSFDRLNFSILRLPRHFNADPSRYAVKCIETLSEDHPVGVSFVFGLIAK